MKGTFFQKPLEYSIEIFGESWNQGDNVKGHLIVKNHGPEELPLNKSGVTLSLTDAKKFKAKNAAGVSVLTTEAFDEAKTVPAGGQEKLDFEFNLASDCPITEKSSSLYINCGELSDPFSGGNLQLTIKPIATISNYLEVFENFFKFKVKTIKNKKGFIDIKMAAPDSKDFGSIEQLNLNISVQDTNLSIKYLFKIKKLAYEAGNVSAKSEKKEIEQTIGKRQHTAFGDSPNQDGIMKAISEVLDQIKSKAQF
ncbi:MAG: hypothetical protein KC493_08570 [Bacteriovoracaceae bacterium]|nr:hypothetical protein [Bacteriovoracaceae bacterium]